MANESKKIELDDEHIAEITKKISQESAGDLSKREALFTRINNQVKPGDSAMQNGQKAGGVPAKDASQEKPRVVIKSLRTFQGDAAEIIKKQNTSILSIALAEKKKQQKEVKTKPPGNPELRKKVLLILASVFLVLLGVGAVMTLFFIQKKAPEVVSLPEQEKTIVGFTTKESLDVSNAGRDNLLETLIAKRLETNLNAGEIAYIALTKKVGESDVLLSPIELFALLDTKSPGSVLRAFDNKFMFGFYRTETNEPFLLIGLSSFENAFDGMLRWEKDMNSDIGALFTRRVLPVTETTKVETAGETSTKATTTEIKTTKVLNLDIPTLSGFTDETVNNKDARVLLSNGGNIILLYSFIDRDTLLITTSRTVLREMVGKIISQKLIR